MVPEQRHLNLSASRMVNDKQPTLGCSSSLEPTPQAFFRCPPDDRFRTFHPGLAVERWLAV